MNDKITYTEIEDGAWNYAQTTLKEMHSEIDMPDTEKCADLYDGFIAGVKWALNRINDKI